MERQTKPFSKRFRIFTFTVIVCVVAMFFWYRAWDRREMLRTTLLWARVAPPPAGKHDFIIQKEGGFFSRSFRCSFSAAPEEVERWLQQSPGTWALLPEKPPATTRHYIISPGGGAQRAEVTVDSSGTVGIYVSWN